jgi:INO80 complex subunit C
MEAELINAELVLPTHFSFKRIQIYEKYPKGQPRGRWKHLKQILQAENYQNCPEYIYFFQSKKGFSFHFKYFYIMFAKTNTY